MFFLLLVFATRGTMRYMSLHIPITSQGQSVFKINPILCTVFIELYDRKLQDAFVLVTIQACDQL